jgi:hypothetical protein
LLETVVMDLRQALNAVRPGEIVHVHVRPPA